ncbi:uncharacterized protein [Diadema antillarum]|uniref:uncharacterized protein n=1 Tax=Diadema antillarum TaxID=105358 RepID=UPI003A8761B8
MDEDLEMEKDDVESEVGQDREVIGMLLSQASDGEDGQLQIHPETEDEVGAEDDESASVVAGTSILEEAKLSLGEESTSLQAVQLTDGSTAIIQQKADGSLLEGQAVQLEDGTTAFIHNLSGKGFEDSQAVQLEDGSTAYILRTNAKVDGDSVQAVQLEDGTTALIQTHVTDFDQSQSAFSSDDPMDASSLNVLEHYAAQNSGEQGGGALQLTTGEHDFTSPMRVTVGSVGQVMPNKVEVLTTKTFQCRHEGCGRMYTASHHLKVHERSHSGVKPYKCEHPGCEKAFATGYGLKSHTRVHTGEKPYRCSHEGCRKGFKTSGDLQKHTRTHTGERPFKCPFEGCEKAFTTSNIRKVHIRTHTGERPYICPQEGCGRAFASATNYKNHMRIHTGEKPYVCTVAGCGKRFTEYSSLYKHHVVHTHSKPYMCSSCGKNYRQISTLAMHKRQAHGEDALVDGLEIAITQGDRPDIVSILGSPPSKKSKSEYQIATVTLSNPGSSAGSLVTPTLTDGVQTTALNQPKTLILQDANGHTRQVTMVSALNRDAALAAMKAAVGNHTMLQVVSDGSLTNLTNLTDMQLQQVMAIGTTEGEEGEKEEDGTASSHLSAETEEAELASVHT